MIIIFVVNSNQHMEITQANLLISTWKHKNGYLDYKSYDTLSYHSSIYNSSLIGSNNFVVFENGIKTQIDESYLYNIISFCENGNGVRREGKANKVGVAD